MSHDLDLALIIPHRYLRRLLITPMANGKNMHGYLMPIVEAMHDGVDEFRRGITDCMAEEEDILVQLVDKARGISHVIAFVVKALVATHSGLQRDTILEAEKQYTAHCIMQRAVRDVAWLAQCKNKRVLIAVEDLDVRLAVKSNRNLILAAIEEQESKKVEDFVLRLPDLIDTGHILYKDFCFQSYGHLDFIIHKNGFPYDRSKWTVTI